MRYHFNRTTEGLVEIALEDDLPLMRDALQDSLDSRPPRGAPQDGPSTYWIDMAIAGLRSRLEDGSSEPFASGNSTYLQLQGTQVAARYDFDPVDSDSVDRVPAEEFIVLLEEWRQRVLDESPDAARRMPPPRPARPMPPA